MYHEVETQVHSLWFGFHGADEQRQSDLVSGSINQQLVTRTHSSDSICCVLAPRLSDQTFARSLSHGSASSHPSLCLTTTSLSPASAQLQPSFSPASAQLQPSFSPASAQLQPSFSPASAQPQPSLSPASAQLQPSFSPASAQLQPSFSPASLYEQGNLFQSSFVIYSPPPPPPTHTHTHTHCRPLFTVTMESWHLGEKEARSSPSPSAPDEAAPHTRRSLLL